MNAKPVLGLTMGDPAGIGPEICLRALGVPAVRKICTPVLFGDADVLARVAGHAGIPAADCRVVSANELETISEINEPLMVNCAAIDASGIAPGEISAACGKASYLYIERAIRAALAGAIDGVVTAPIHKESLHLSGVKFPGHTEIFTALTGAKRSCMMLHSDKLTVSMATTHIGYHEVPGKLSVARVSDVIELTAEAMRRILRREPRLGVCGLNPHAGEHGLFGNREEEIFVAPAVKAAREHGIQIEGPLVPDAAFTTGMRGKFDAIVTLYHDQGHIPFKMLAFDTGVNITLGLPIVRTSVDHGTAFDIAWQGKADPTSLFSAIRVAAELAEANKEDSRPAPGERNGSHRVNRKSQVLKSKMIGVIADDLTGAAELGAVGLRHGLRAEIVRRGQPSGKADLVCVDTDSRSCDPVEAGRRAAAAARLLHQAGAEWIYKKVDSVLRGQVTAEVEAVMKQLQLNRALLLPANPSLGRVIRDGQYFVRGKPIHKTEFARDPEYPRRAPQVMRLLKLPETFSLRLSNGDHSLSDDTIVVGGAATSADVREWAVCREADMLPAGGSEFFGALLAAILALAPASGEETLPDAAPGRELFVCGTSTESARKFVSAARRRKTPVFSLPRELIWGADFSVAAQQAVTQRVVAAFETDSRVILNVGLPPVRNPAVARPLSDCVVKIAGRVLRQLSVPNVFAEGGATAAELVRRMGWARLAVLRELAPGVARLAVDGDQSILLTIKPGTYAWPAKWT